MAVELPGLTQAEFGERLLAALSAEARAAIEALPPGVVERCFGHYQELRRWARSTSLVGPGTASEVVERHWAESLEALPLLPASGALLDIGTGAGFPGMPLACARLDLEVFLIEPRARKVEFLRAAARAAAVDCQVFASAVRRNLPTQLPEKIDCVTLRALKLEEKSWRALAKRLSSDSRVLLWAGEGLPDLPPVLEQVAEQPLAGATVRRLVVYRLRREVETLERG